MFGLRGPVLCALAATAFNFGPKKPLPAKPVPPTLKERVAAATERFRLPDDAGAFARGTLAGVACGAEDSPGRVAAAGPPPRARSASIVFGSVGSGRRRRMRGRSERSKRMRRSVQNRSRRPSGEQPPAQVALSIFVAIGPVGDAVSLAESRETREAAAQFAVVLDALDRGYVDSVSPKKLMESAVEAMLATLDPYRRPSGELARWS